MATLQQSTINSFRFGKAAGNQNYTAAFGRYALNSTNNYSTGAGYRVGLNNTSYSAFGGARAGESNSGVSNVGIGFCAFNGSGGRYQSTAVGQRAQRSSTSGRHNVAIGSFAFDAGSSHVQSVALGVNAGRNSNADNATFIGVNAGCSVSGTENTFIGFDAGRSHTSGYGTMGIGRCAGYSANAVRAISIGSSTSATGTWHIAWGGSGNNTCAINKSSAGTIIVRGNITGATLAPTVTAGLISTAGNTVVIGNVTGCLTSGNANNFGINQSAGSLIVVGNIIGGTQQASSNQAIIFTGTSLTITGSIIGGSAALASSAINITSTPTVNISGSINGASNVGIQSATAITMTVTGSVNGSSAAAGISLTGASVLNVRGPITAGSGAVGISSTSTSATNRLTGPFITGPTGIQPFYGPKLTIVTGSATFWTFTSPTVSINKTLFSTDLVSGVPSPSDVRQGVTYASGALVGTMIVPSTSSVAFGVPVDIYTGSAIIAGSNYNISNEIWNTPVTSLTGSSTIGARLSNSATIASTGAQIAALAGR